MLFDSGPLQNLARKAFLFPTCKVLQNLKERGLCELTYQTASADKGAKMGVHSYANSVGHQITKTVKLVGSIEAKAHASRGLLWLWGNPTSFKCLSIPRELISQNSL